MKQFLSFFLLLTFLSVSFHSKSQGCSDGGLCALGSLSITSFKFETLSAEKKTLSAVSLEDTQLKLQTLAKKDGFAQEDAPINDSTSSKYLKYSLGLTSYYGLSHQSTSIFTQQLEGNVAVVKEKLFAQLKIPYTIVSGKLGTTDGIGDFTASFSYIAFNKPNSNLSFSGGLKLPSNDANIYKSGLPLPMVYQTSLGSTDVLLGAKYMLHGWDFTLGYQHSLNANNNQYIKKSGVKDSVTYNSYFESNHMRRADDGVFRIVKNFKIKNAITSAGVLFIYHLANDHITDALGNRVQAYGSKGLTLNLNLAGTIPINKTSNFLFVVGAPIVTRAYGTDGLTRYFVFIAGVKFDFYEANN